MLPNNSTVTALAATGANDAWVAGTVCANASCDRNTLLVRRWNGKAWTVIPVPKADVNSNSLVGATAVAATSAASAWVLSLSGAGTQAISTILMHWTGKSWGATANLPGEVIAAVAPGVRDAWAFGVGKASSIGSAYAAHYNGTKWSQVRVPVVGVGGSATSASDIWAIGFPTSVSTTTRQAFGIMHYNGKAWRRTPVPSLRLASSQVAIATAITAVSPTNVWADGQIMTTSSPGNPAAKLFLLHWNGRKWAVIKVPYAGFPQGPLAQDGHGGVWMSLMPLGNGIVNGEILHYGNGTWSRVAAPRQASESLQPAALAWIPGTRSVWGIGSEIPTGSAAAAPSVILKYGA